MVFSDLFFLFVFLPAFMLFYLAATWIDNATSGDKIRKSCTCRNFALVIFSLIFYAWGEPVYVFLMLGSVVVNYFAGRVIDSQERHRKLALIIGLICNLGILAVFKYLNFFTEILSNIGLHVANPHIALPIGISFYTFQSISYLVDVYRRESPAQKKFYNLLLYISMFPQLIAGPIVRYDTVAREISNRHVSMDDFADGVFRFSLGLGKKVILANQFAVIADQFLKDGIGDLTTHGAWLGIAAFTLQIYFDFSGYSDMAIGIGRCLGFHFKENFNHPYCCDSMTDLWRRWHISLGSFFRDYLYIPLGGNRRHQMLNIFVVWFLTGMWHGASWNFILWGLYFAVLLVFEKHTLLKMKKAVLDRKQNLFTRTFILFPGWVFMHAYALFFLVLGWGIFYFEDLSQCGSFFTALFGGGKENVLLTTQSVIYDNFWLWIVGILFCLPVRKYASRLVTVITGKGSKAEDVIFTTTRLAFTLAVLVISVSLLVGATNNPFLYTRF